MVKNIHRSTLALFEQYIGQTTTSLAKKKARLVFSEPQDDMDTADQTQNIDYFDVVLEDLNNDSKPSISLKLASYPGTFSHGKLDWGTAFMLESIVSYSHTIEQAKTILDLGCGTGALGIVAALKAPEAQVLFVDESHIAVRSCKESLEHSLNEKQRQNCQISAAANLNGIDAGSQDVVLNNPPFHDTSARTPAIALGMFADAHRVLRKGGELIVVANRHLGYHSYLKKPFNKVKLLASNKKFVLLRATK